MARVRYMYTYISGDGYRQLCLTFEGQLVAVLTREESAKAHALQFGLLYVYGISYTAKIKKEKPMSYFFEFVTYFLWNIRPNKGSRKKRVCTNVQNLWEKINKSA